LKKLCESSNVSIAMVIHQPREEIFWKFDHLIILQKKQTLFSGSPKTLPASLTSQISSEGIRSNPADALMDYLEGQSSYKNLKFDKDPIDMPDVVKEPTRSLRGVPPPVNEFRQFVSQLYRTGLIEFNSTGDFLVSLLTMAGAGFLVGALFSSQDIAKAPVLVFMCNLTAQVLSAVNAVKIFGRSDEKHMFDRESHAGISRMAYFLAKTSYDLFYTVLYTALYILLFFAFGTPRGQLADYFLITLLGQFTARAVAHFISLMIGENSAPLAVVVVLLVFNFTCGFQPTISELRNVPIAATFPYFSYSRYAFQYLMTKELNAFPPIFKYEVAALFSNFAFHFDTDLGTRCLMPLILYGVFFRLLTLGSLYSMGRRETSYDYLKQIYGRWRVVTILLWYVFTNWMRLIESSFWAKAIVAFFSFHYSIINTNNPFVLGSQEADVILSISFSAFCFIYLYHCIKSWVPVFIPSLFFIASTVVNAACIAVTPSAIVFYVNTCLSGLCAFMCLLANAWKFYRTTYQILNQISTKSKEMWERGTKKKKISRSKSEEQEGLIQ